jgi:uncharacterized protein (TIGR02646 family)
MIRVSKNNSAPVLLLRAGNTEYNHQEVQRQLIEDQQGKCYLCERICVTDYQIEHLQSVHYHPELKCDWTNLFLSCSYCNGKKLENYDDILDPSTNDVENMIACEHDIARKKVVFCPIGETTSAITQTIQLLEKVFNGKNPIRAVKEERFYEYFLGRMNHFLSVLNDFVSDRSPQHRQAVEEELQIDKEFLAFKYHLINHNSTLLDEFHDDMKWNRVS